MLERAEECLAQSPGESDRQKRNRSADPADTDGTGHPLVGVTTYHCRNANPANGERRVRGHRAENVVCPCDPPARPFADRLGLPRVPASLRPAASVSSFGLARRRGHWDASEPREAPALSGRPDTTRDGASVETSFTPALGPYLPTCDAEQQNQQLVRQIRQRPPAPERLPPASALPRRCPRSGVGPHPRPVPDSGRQQLHTDPDL